MQTFKDSDLQIDPDALLKDAEAGNLAVVTRDGRPIFVAVPVDARLLETGVFEALAVRLYSEGSLSLSRAAEFARQPIERFLEALALAGVPAVAYDPGDLDEELARFS